MEQEIESDEEESEYEEFEYEDDENTFIFEIRKTKKRDATTDLNLS